MHFMRAIFGAGIVAIAAATSSAAVITITDTDGDPTHVDVAPGGTFQIQVTLKTFDNQIPPEDVIGVGFVLHASQSNVFTISDRTIDAGNEFLDLTRTNAQIQADGPGLNPRNASDLGGATLDGLTRTPGTYDLYTFTIAVSPNASAGTYQINTTDGALTYANFDTLLVSNSPVYNVTVPEPLFFSVLGLACGGLAFRQRAPIARR